MVQRGYDGTMPLLKQEPFRMGEVLFSAVAVTLLGIVWQLI
jgi:cobalt/nickel transport system permease protein